MRLAPAILLVLALVAAAPRVAGAQGRAGSIDVWVYQSLATQSLKDWNDRNDIINTGLDFFGVPGEVHGFGRAIPYGLQVDYRLTPGVSVGLAVGRQRATTNNAFNDVVGFIVPDVPIAYGENTEITLVTTRAVVGARIPATPDLFVWGEIGYGFAEAETRTSFTPLADPASAVTTEAAWDGSGLVGGISLGMRREIGGRSMLRASVGYLMANMGELDGPGGPPLGLSPTGGPGAPMKTDFSGFHISGALGIVLFGAR